MFFCEGAAGGRVGWRSCCGRAYWRQGVAAGGAAAGTGAGGRLRQHQPVGALGPVATVLGARAVDAEQQPAQLELLVPPHYLGGRSAGQAQATGLLPAWAVGVSDQPRRA